MCKWIFLAKNTYVTTYKKYLYLESISVQCPTFCDILYKLFFISFTLSNLSEHFDQCIWTFWSMHLNTLINASEHFDHCIYAFWSMYLSILINVSEHFDQCIWTFSFFISNTLHFFPRHDSDVYAPYGRLKPKSKSKSLEIPNKENMEEVRILWLVSHCKTTSHREKYYGELRKYVHVSLMLYHCISNVNCSQSASGAYLHCQVVPTSNFY